MSPGLSQRSTIGHSSLVEVLRARAMERPDRPAYAFLTDGTVETDSWTYGELDARARAIGAALAREAQPGERALLLFPPGLDFIAAFFGCLYAGVVAVPCYPPRPRRDHPRLRAIARDARPRLVLTTAELAARRESVAERVPELSAAGWIAMSELGEIGEIGEIGTALAGSWEERVVTSEMPAFLQYTSGSTALPKGVIVTHGNILHNEEMIRAAFGQSEESVVVGWLPLYHDMGLIGNVLQPLYAGGSAVLMPPIAFLQRPARWLEAVSRYRATTSGGPNFAYELCVRKVSAEDRAKLDLSSWRLAFNGAEPVRASTLERFAETFAECGFRREAFYPCYGLAEATLFVAGGRRGEPAAVGSFDPAALERGRAVPAAAEDGAAGAARTLVGCGHAWEAQRVAIADPETGAALPPGRVGEIWVAGPSVASGYWNRPEETARTFGASLEGGDRYLRTGDLGFLWGGELFITGRLKDLIILRGRNLYPQDVELAAEASHPALEPAGGAAFAVEVGGEERLVVVHEVGRRFRPEPAAVAEVAAAIRRAVAEEQEAHVQEVVLIRPGTLPRTSSGKVQRHATRAAWQAGELAVVARDAAAVVEGEEIAEGALPDLATLRGLAPEDRRAALEGFLRAELARAAGVEAAAVDPSRPPAEHGLDSVMAMELSHRVEGALEVSVPLARWLEAASLTALAEEMAGAVGSPHPLAPSPAPTSPLPGRGGIGEDEVFPLSYGQRGLWFLERWAPEAAAYNIAVPIRLRGALDAEALGRAFAALVERHPALRTTFEEQGGEPVQRVWAELAPEMLVEDAGRWSEEELRARLGREAWRPFDLGRGPLLRIALFGRGGGEQVLLLAVHHLVADFWSLSVLARELEALYRQETGGGAAAFEPPLRTTRTYADHVARERQRMAGPEAERLWAWWSERLSGELPALDLPADRVRPAIPSWRGGSAVLPLGTELTSALSVLARGRGVTLFAALLAGFQGLLHRLSGQDDLIVGSPAAGRTSADLAGVVGYFVDALPIRSSLAGDPAFAELLARTAATVTGALAHPVALPLLAERLHPERDPGRSPLFQAMFVLQRAQRLGGERAWGSFALGEDGARAELAGLVAESIALPERRVPFDLTLMVAEGSEGLTASLQYAADLFDPATAARIAGYFRTLLAGAVAEPELPVSELPLMSEAERRQVLADWEEMPAEPAEGLLHELVFAQAARTPETVALVAGEERWTYRELAARAAELAARLRAIGIGPEQRVGICTRRTPGMVAGLLAILESGGAYVPLDPTHPRPRLARILADARPSALLVEEGLEEVLPESGVPVVELSAAPSGLGLQGGGLPGVETPGFIPSPLRGWGPFPDHLAYLIYTSGSTGEPKGVAIRHSSAVAMVRWAWETYSEAELAGVLASTSIGFDLSVFELFVPLSRGGAVILAENALALPELPAAGDVTLVNTVPSAMSTLLRTTGLPASVRTVNLAGEPLTRELAARLYEVPSVERVFNLYGPSEDTTYSTFSLVKRGETPTIGRALPGSRAVVLDRTLRPAPLGVAGELCLGGVGLARGYLGRPDLTAERFIPDPFSNVPGERLYRTGDLARLRADGQLEFLGRIDHQVKVRGFRVEPGEVEAFLATHPAVAEAVVVARGEGGERSLVAFVIRRDESVEAAALRAFLQESLPPHLVPTAFVFVETFPRTATGKIDRKALARTAPVSSETMEATTPRTPVEEILAGLWAELLGVERVGPRDDFFALGGHSLLAARLMARLHETFGVELPLRAVFARPTVAALAAEIEAALGGAMVPAVPLVTVPRDGSLLPASFAQEQLWLFERLRPGSAAYNVPVVFHLSGGADASALAAALGEMAHRHEALRTTLEDDGAGRTVQRVHPPAAVPLPVVDLGGLPSGEAEAEHLAAREAGRPFDLTLGPLFRATLLRLGNGEHRLLATLHHSIADVRSLDVLFSELVAFYGGQGGELPSLPVQYADFAAWQRARLNGEALEGLLAFWRRQLDGAETVLQLPADRPRPAVQSASGATRWLPLAGVDGEALRALARTAGATPFMLFLAVFEALVHRLTGLEDFCLGSPVSTRSRAELDGVIGFFVNVFVLRATPRAESSFRSLLDEVRTAALAAYVHAELPFEKLVEDLAPERSASYGPLVQVMFALEEATDAPREAAGVTWRAEAVDRGAAQFDFSLAVQTGGAGLRAAVEYASDLFDAPTIDRYLGLLGNLLASAAADPGRPLSELALLGEAERAQLVYEWNDTAAIIPADVPAHVLIARQAERAPDATAVTVAGDPGQWLSYGELRRRTVRLGARLAALGVGPEVPVALLLERSLELTVAVLGVLEAGGMYVPLDPAHPADRLRFVLEDSGAPVVLTQGHLLDRLPAGTAARPLIVEEAVESTEPAALIEVWVEVLPQNTAYVIYTSGSTGRPKGVAVSHGALAHQTRVVADFCRLGPKDRVLQFASISFDVAVEELFPTWFAGSCVVLWPAAPVSGPAEMTRLVERLEVTSFQLSTQYWQDWTTELARAGRPAPPSIRYVMAGGDAVSASHLALWRETVGDAVDWWNGYGPTETTVTSTGYRLPGAGAPTLAGSNRTVPIGLPYPGEQAHVVDRAGSLVPIGVAGELWIGGACLARGYVGRPELTAARFAPDPFGGEPGGRVYRTGDLVRRLATGDLEFLGRLDRQVKLRGFRIELGEVESALAACPLVREAAVILTGTGAESRLVAFVAPVSPEVTARELRDWLRGVLPEPMVPGAFALLPALPHTASDKIDRRALSRLPLQAGEAGESADETAAPRNATEEILTGIWAEVLGLARAGIHDHFFERGGHSLLATRVVSRVREAFAVEIPLARIFDAPTPAALAPILEEALREAKELNAPPIVPVPRAGDLPLSFAQERLWFLDRLQPGGSAYNMATGLALAGDLAARQLEAALLEVVRRHESLRTTFAERASVPVQVIAPEVAWTLPRLDLSALPAEKAEAETQRLLADEARRPFDLERGPLLRAVLLRRGAEDHALLFDMHHIVSDGWSAGVLVHEVTALYAAFAEGRPSPLPELPVQYADFAVWQRGWLSGEALERQLGYWRERLAGAPSLDLPTDRPRPAVPAFRGASIRFGLDSQVTAGLARFARRHDATLYMALLAGFAALLRRVTGQDDLVVGSPVANRNRAEIEPLIGFFVNTLVLRTDAAGDPLLPELLARVRNAAFGAYAYQDLPFERLVEELRPERTLSYNPLFQVMFALQNAPLGEITLPGLAVSLIPAELPQSKFDLGLTFTESGDGLAVELEYSLDLFDEATARRMAGHVSTLLAGLAADPERRASELPLLSEMEQRQLTDWSGGGEPVEEAGVLARFEAQAAFGPEREAVITAGEAVSYGELDRRAALLARRLRELGVGPGVTVGLCAERSAWIAAGILGIWKAGGAYVPLDPALPQARLAYLLEDSGVSVVVTQRGVEETLPSRAAQTVFVEDLTDETEAAPTFELPAPDTLAYMIYTSGTTGLPKAVMVEHGSLAATLGALGRAFGFDPEDRMPCVAPFSFDIFLFELLAPLLAGGTSVLVPLRPVLDIERLAGELAEATAFHAVPALMRQVVDAVRAREVNAPRLRSLFVGGDVVPAELVADLRQAFPSATPSVMYGPTEATIICTAYPVPETGPPRSLLGRPLGSARVELRDREGQLVPVGVAGEIWIAGPGVARGYWRRDELTAEKFVERDGRRWYRSGDLARRLADGTLEFLGRADQQVKVRGFRIELGEVEGALARHPEVREAVAVVREDAAGKRLVAYVVRRPAAEMEVAPEETAQHVAQWQALYEETYGRVAETADPTFNTEGWNSSYTGEPIPAAEMREWVDATVERVLALPHERVLEVGCGTGLLLFRVAPHTGLYRATDFSPSALAGIRRRLELPQVDLVQATADDWRGVEPGTFDLVVLNSVAQYFPGADYLARVLEGAVAAVAPGGAVFLGDVRSLPLAEALHLSIELHQPQGTSGGEGLAELRRRVAHRFEDEEELLLAPSFFTALAERLPEITGIEVLLKRGRTHNELTCFRYDVVLRVGERAVPAAVAREERAEDLAGIEELLAERPEAIVFRGLPNARLAREEVAVELLAEQGVATAEELRRLAEERATAGIDPEELWELGERLGYEVALGPDPKSPFRLDARFVRVGAGLVPAREGASPSPTPVLSFPALSLAGGPHANDPLRAKLSRQLVPELRRFLHTELPEYMVPSAFVLLDALPLTAHGKVDRAALPDPAPERAAAGAITPRTPLEERIAEACADVLGLVDPAGMDDNFFELGGHSLLATQLVSRLRERWGIEVPVRAVFEAPALGDLADLVMERELGDAARGLDREERSRLFEERRAGTERAAGQIPRRPAGNDVLPLSFAQERLWFLDRIEAGTAYNMPMALALHGDLSVPAFEAAFRELVRRHENLRTTFEMRGEVGGMPVQVVGPAGDWRLLRVDLAGVASPEAVEAEVRRLVEADAWRPFDLGRGPLLRGALVRKGAGEHLLLVDKHHIISDGWSMGVLIREVSALYAAALEGSPSPLPELPIQYGDFAVWQRGWLTGDVLEAQLAYWRERLDGAPALDLPTDKPRPAVQSFRGATVWFEVEAGLTRGLAALARQADGTLYMALLALSQSLLGRYAGQEDLVTGSAIANRNRAELEPLIGFFVNSLVLRGDLTGDPSFTELLARARQTTLGAYSHQDLPFERLVEELRPERNLSHNPLFQVMCVLQNAPAGRIDLPGLWFAPAELDYPTTRFDLELMFWEKGDSLSVDFTYATDLFEETTVRRLAGHFLSLAAGALADPDRPLSDLPILAPAESHQLLHEWSDTAAPLPDATLIDLFHEQATRRPDAVAVSSIEGDLTYAELASRATRLAHRLLAAGAAPDLPVALLADRTPAMITALLAILEAGGAYLPLDPAYPPERLARMREDAGADLLLADPDLLTRLGDTFRPGTVLDLTGSTLLPNERPGGEGPGAGDWQRGRGPGGGVGDGESAHEGAEHGPLSPRPDNLAYVVFTSGSTGRPKGVAVTHRNVVRLVRESRFADLGPDQVFLQLAPISFDAATLEIWGALANGGRLVLFPPGRPSLEELGETIETRGVTTLWLTAGLFHQMVDGPLASLRGLRQLLAGGDVLSPEHVRRALASLPGCTVINGYGPTEGTTFTACHPMTRPEDIPEGATVPIGTPVGNTRVLVLGRDLRPVPAGVYGELYAGGGGLARGYLNRPDLTAERFVPDPFGMPGDRLYRTGDLARWRPDGRLEFLGRRDGQLKLRGYRVELGEIEGALARHPEVREVAVVVQDDLDGSGNKRLVACVVHRPAEAAAEAAASGEAAEHVAHWQELYEETYGQGPASGEQEGDPTFNIQGWNSTYTSEPIPAEEMREWVDATVEGLLGLRHERVLEIGCGTGLLLFRVAPHARLYRGTDFSAVALGYVRNQLARPGIELLQVELAQGLADDWRGVEPGSFDLVVLNSVVQYFPGIDYLARVLEGAVRAVAPGGSVFIGDVRSLPLLEALHASVELHQARESRGVLRVSELKRRIGRRVADEEELVIDPLFFHALARRVPGIAGVEVRAKRGRAHNELTRFRYDVVLRVGETPIAPASPPRLNFGAEGGPASLTELERYLTDGLVVAGIPNARLATEAAALDLLSTRGFETAEKLLRAVADRPSLAIDPEEVRDLAARLGLEVRILWGLASPFQLTAVFGGVALDGPEEGSRPLDLPWPAYANDPLRRQLARRLVPELRHFLQAELPEYMVPGAFVLLDALPLTANGKVDRAALSRLAPVSAAAPVQSRVAPRTPTEEKVAAVWREVLGVESFGIHDDFFELGGHSLLATQAVSRLRQAAGVEIPLRLLFEAPTVAALAREIEALERAGRGLEAPPIVRIERQGEPPLSFAQEWMWLVDQLGSDGATLISMIPVRLAGRLDVPSLGAALDELVRRHEVLRTTFPVGAAGRPVQRIAAPGRLPLPLVDLQALPEAAREAEAKRLAEAESARRMDLGRGPLVRATLLHLGREDHSLLLAPHHILFDGWSLGVLLREMAAHYEASVEGRRHLQTPLPELPVQYADYSLWQHQWLQGEVLDEMLGYWKKQLAPPLAVLELPGARPGATESLNSDRLPVLIDAETAAALRGFARGSGVTLFVTLLAAFQTLLHRYTRQTDLPVGSSVANRNRSEIEGLIGYFVNTLVLRSDLGGDPSFRELAGRVREVALGAYAHQDLPFTRLVEELQPDRAASRTPLFQAFFLLQNMPMPKIELPGLAMSGLDSDAPMATFDLALVLSEEERGLAGSLWYNRDLLDQGTMSLMMERFQTLLAGAAADPACRLSALPLVSTAERRQLLAAADRFLAPAADDGDGDGGDAEAGTLHRRFKDRVRDDPEAVALVYEGDEVTYRELDEESNRLAWHLQELGVGPEVLVGICLERKPEMIISILAVLKAGGAYLPLDPDYPQERLRYLIEDSGARVLVTRGELAQRLPALPAGVWTVDLDAEAAALARRDGATAPASGATLANLAYVIYTSGSTGRPKAVQVTHGNVARLFESTDDWFRFDERDTWTLFHSFAFDFSVWEIWGALLHGGKLVIVPFWVSRSPDAFLELLERERVTVLNQTPSAFAQLAFEIVAEGGGRKGLKSLRWVIFGGEALAVHSLAPWFESYGDRRPRLVNMYGITETTVHVTFRPLTAADTTAGSMIGEPIPDLTVHILDEHLQPVPPGLPGEMYVGGAGLSRGYLGRPVLTAERFVPDPFAEPSAKGARLYRTGDLARLTPEGDLEYLGRADEQVKIRGFRIEPGEVETALASHPAVAEAAVVAREDEMGVRLLVGYVTPDPRQAQPMRRLLALQREGRLAGRATYELPNGMVVVHQHEGVTASIYKEIFEGEVYRRNGIELPPGACVFDIGANLGLFTLWAGTTVPGARIFSFEPIPATAEVLRLNAELYGLDATVYDAGVADGERTEVFTYYPYFPSTSGRFPDLSKDRADIKAHILNEQRVIGEELGGGGFEAWRDEREGALDSWLDEHMKSERVSCRLTTVSAVIREHGLARIDLLKIDAERSELDVLAGIAEEDWPKIRQMVLEVHDAGIRDRVLAVLEAHGFDAVVEQDVYLQGTELFNVYAYARGGREGKPAEAASSSAAPAKVWSSPARLAEDLRHWAAERLPEHMVPSALVVLESLPLTAHGKLDRRALPAPADAARPVERSIVEPRTPVEREMVGIWKELLRVDRMSIYDNFFELGGHSLLLTQLASRIRTAFQVEVPLRVLFDVKDVVEMTAAIAERQVAEVSQEEMAEMLDELKGLSPEEIKALLEAES